MFSNRTICGLFKEDAQMQYFEHHHQSVLHIIEPLNIEIAGNGHNLNMGSYRDRFSEILITEMLKLVGQF